MHRICRCRCRCRCRLSKCNTNANTGANTTSEIDKRGRKTKLRHMYSGTNANVIHMQLQHLKLIKVVAKRNLRRGPRELNARRWGNQSLHDGGTALPPDPNRYPFFTVTTAQASLVVEQLKNFCLFLVVGQAKGPIHPVWGHLLTFGRAGRRYNGLVEVAHTFLLFFRKSIS